jgi:hypothetical protein
MNILLSGDKEEGYDRDVALTLKEWELHNLIVTMWHAAKRSDPEGHSAGVYMQTAQRLEHHWQRSLRRSWVDRR